MDRERLTSLISDPTQLVNADMAHLRELTGRYPWFAGAHFLQAAAEHAAGGVLSGETLGTAAAHIPHRAALYDVIHPVEAPVPMSAPVIPVDLPAPGTATPGTTTPPPPLPTAFAPVLPVLQPALPPPVVHPPPSPTSHGPLEKEPGIPGDNAAIPLVEPPPETDELDMQVRNAAMAQSYEFLLEHDPGPITTPPVAAPPPATLPASPSPLVAPPPVVPLGGRMRFTDWLATPPGTLVPPTARPTLSPPAERASSAQERTPRPKIAYPGAQQGDPGQLIDRFIEQSAPPAPVQKTGFFKPQVVAKQSLDDTAGLVTETLARIHEQQGNFTKAMETYQRLALKYPDKSAYFAALSKAVEARSNK